MPSEAPSNQTPWIRDGEVSSIVQVGNMMIAAGSFSTVNGPGGSPAYSRSNIVAFDAGTGAVSTTFNAAWDSLSALENWVEDGVAPVNQIVTDTVGVPGRTRPLCEFPAWPRYSGSGDINVAASYTCATL